MLGYREVDDYGSYYRYSPRVSEVIVPKNVQQFLLPKLAATGRLARVKEGPYHQAEFEDLRPVAWDDGLPWRFRLDIQADDAHRRWILGGQLYRPQSEQTLPIEAPQAVFKQGLVLLEDRIAPLETNGSSRMIEALRKNPRVDVPYEDRWELLRRLWQLPNGPEMNVPDNLRVEEVSLPPQGRLRVDKPERSDPYRLPGRVDFLYDGKAVTAEETRHEGSSTRKRGGSWSAIGSASASWPPRWLPAAFGPWRAGRPRNTASGSPAKSSPRRSNRWWPRGGSSRPRDFPFAGPARGG